MILYTVALSNWRYAKSLDIPLLDTTVKSGDRVFAPSWDIVRDVKAGVITEEEYTRHYKELMRVSYKANPDRWLEVCGMDMVAIACYCAAEKFCHRHLLAEYLKKVCRQYQIPFEFGGELKPPK